MGRVKFDIQLKLAHPKKHWQKRKNKAYCQVTQDRFKEKQAQIGKAVQWCQKNGKRGWAALRTGKFPLIKYVKTINRRLDGEVVHDEEKSYCSILTKDEELQIVRHIKNRNRCIQGLNRAEITTPIIYVLKVRQLVLQKFYGRKLKPLSNAAKKVLENNRLSKSFWKCWDAKHSSITRKQPGNVNLNRAPNCTQAIAEEHLDQLADEMQHLGIFTDAIHVSILKSICSKSACRGEDGSKPTMIPLMWLSKHKHSAKQKLANVFDGSDTSDSNEYRLSEYEDVFTDNGGEDEISHNGDGDNSFDIHHNKNCVNDDGVKMTVPESLKCGDYVKVFSGLFTELYATVLGKSYGDEVEIQYFQERFGKWILTENDIDSRLPEELIKVTAKMDRQSYFIFSD